MKLFVIIMLLGVFNFATCGKKDDDDPNKYDPFQNPGGSDEKSSGKEGCVAYRERAPDGPSPKKKEDCEKKCQKAKDEGKICAKATHMGSNYWYKNSCEMKCDEAWKVDNEHCEEMCVPAN